VTARDYFLLSYSTPSDSVYKGEDYAIFTVHMCACVYEQDKSKSWTDRDENWAELPIVVRILGMD